MANVSVYNMEGSEVEKMDLNDNVFAVEVNEHLMHMAVVLQLANKRQEQVMQDRDLSALHSGQAVELYLLQRQEITPSR